MERHPDTPWPRRFAIAACLLFFLMGQPFVPLLGLNSDEEIFGYAFLAPHSLNWTYLGGSVPVEFIGYCGALKAWIYRPIFAVFGTGVWSQREPMLLAGAASIWLFFLLLRRIAGNRAAVIGAGLLAVDSMYLLTACYERGTVALQHLLLVGGMLLALRFYQEGGWASLAGGFFLFGLAMWDKALAVWMLSAMGVAGVTVFWSPIRRAITARRMAIAILAFTLGALPLVGYNVRSHLHTFRLATYGTSGMAVKGRVLVKTMLGSQLFGGPFEEDWQNPQPAAPGNALEKASLTLSELAGRPRANLLLPAFLLALALAAWTRGGERRAIVFCLIAMAVQWVQMAITVDAGDWPHHTVLLWPLPQLAIGVSFASASRRLGRAAVPALACMLAVLMCAGALQINEYYRVAWRNGGEIYWTNAIYRLSGYLMRLHAERVYSINVGIAMPLRVLTNGAPPVDLIEVWETSGPQAEVFVRLDSARQVRADPSDRESPGMQRFLAMVGQPNNVFVDYAKAWNPPEDAEFPVLAAAAGYQPETLATIPDSFGRTVYEVYHFVRK